ncbi:MAG: hypothetical protein H7841_17435 [Magnetospirillum sp. WYHS-4]
MNPKHPYFGAVAVALVASLLTLGGIAVSGTAQGAGKGDAKPDYQRARWDPIHFQPAIDKATDEQCLACHKEILEDKVLPATPAGPKTAAAKAWYQTLDTYLGEQDTFHRRHIATPYAKEVMDLKCNFCHRGNDPREEAPPADKTTAAGFTLRKMVDTSETCLMCHGRFVFENMEGLEGPWHQVRANLESDDAPNGCLTCHAELFRTVRHQVSYLKAGAIEDLAKDNSDVCYGCHGGRSWYRISYPYPRHPWPNMPEGTPEWAKGRPAESNPRYAIGEKK